MLIFIINFRKISNVKLKVNLTFIYIKDIPKEK